LEGSDVIDGPFERGSASGESSLIWRLPSIADIRTIDVDPRMKSPPGMLPHPPQLPRCPTMAAASHRIPVSVMVGMTPAFQP